MICVSRMGLDYVETNPVQSVIHAARESTLQDLQIYVVNLHFRQERWMRMQRVVMKSNLLSNENTYRHDAIVGINQTLPELEASHRLSCSAYRSLLSHRNVIGIYMTPGGLGCILSHIALWEQAIELNRPILVLEDDVSLVSDFDQVFHEILEQLPSTFGLLYLADLVNNHKSKAAERIVADAPLLNRLTGEHWGTFAYLISPAAAQILYDSVYPIRYQVDSYMIETSQAKGIEVYRSRKNLVLTDNSDQRQSDVQQWNSPVSRLIPTRVLLLECIHPFDQSQLEYPVEVFDTVRLYQELNIDLDGLAQSNPKYELLLLRTRLALLYDHGGMIIDSTWSIQHPLELVLSNCGGIIGYDSSQLSTTGLYQFPILAMRPSHPMTKDLVMKIDGLISKHHHSGPGIRELYTYLAQQSSYFPTNDTLLIFPAKILSRHGY